MLSYVHFVSIVDKITDLGGHLKVTKLLSTGQGISGLILGLRPANEWRRYKVTPSLIGWAQT